VLYNSGCANAVTGERGSTTGGVCVPWGASAIGAAETNCWVLLDRRVIGRFPDMEKLARGVPDAALPGRVRAPGDAARAHHDDDTLAKPAPRN